MRGLRRAWWLENGGFPPEFCDLNFDKLFFYMPKMTKATLAPMSFVLGFLKDSIFTVFGQKNFVLSNNCVGHYASTTMVERETVREVNDKT